jgi:hypothetical protein
VDKEQSKFNTLPRHIFLVLEKNEEGSWPRLTKESSKGDKHIKVGLRIAGERWMLTPPGLGPVPFLRAASMRRAALWPGEYMPPVPPMPLVAPTRGAVKRWASEWDAGGRGAGLLGAFAGL